MWLMRTEHQSRRCFRPFEPRINEHKRRATTISLLILFKEAPNTDHNKVYIQVFPNHIHKIKKNYNSIQYTSLVVSGYFDAVTTRSWYQLSVIKFPGSKLRWKTYKSPARTCAPLWRPNRNKNGARQMSVLTSNKGHVLCVSVCRWGWEAGVLDWSRRKSKSRQYVDSLGHNRRALKHEQWATQFRTMPPEIR